VPIHGRTGTRGGYWIAPGSVVVVAPLAAAPRPAAAARPRPSKPDTGQSVAVPRDLMRLLRAAAKRESRLTGKPASVEDMLRLAIEEFCG
jgi:hypothetical protein